MSASFFDMVEASLTVSGTTTYDWGTVSTTAKSKVETFKIIVKVPPSEYIFINFL